MFQDISKVEFGGGNSESGSASFRRIGLLLFSSEFFVNHGVPESVSYFRSGEVDDVIVAVVGQHDAIIVVPGAPISVLADMDWRSAVSGAAVSVQQGNAGSLGFTGLKDACAMMQSISDGAMASVVGVGLSLDWYPELRRFLVQENMVKADSSPSPEEQEEWHRTGELRKAAEAGHVRAQADLGDKYMYGVGVPQNKEQAKTWYRRAAEQGDLVAQKRLAAALSKDDEEQSVHWYRRAAEQGDPEAMLGLGRSYEEGKGVERNYGLAAYWYMLATTYGKGLPQSFAATNLGDLYLHRRDAKGWKTDDRQNALDQWSYEHSKEGRKNIEQSAYWYRQAIALVPEPDDFNDAEYVRTHKLEPLLERFPYLAK